MPWTMTGKVIASFIAIAGVLIFSVTTFAGDARHSETHFENPIRIYNFRVEFDRVAATPETPPTLGTDGNTLLGSNNPLGGGKLDQSSSLNAAGAPAAPGVPGGLRGR